MPKTNEETFVSFKDFDRFSFPEGIVRVTAGHGGEAILISGSEKTALLDCGMAYCSSLLIENLSRELGGRKLDYILVSHTHYDHIGALPFVRKAWPGLKVIGASYAQKVFSSTGAINTIISLSQNAAGMYAGDPGMQIPAEGFSIDRVVEDGDTVSLGEEEFVVIETKGHTDCSLSFLLNPENMLFLSESTGVLEAPDKMHVTILKSYQDTMVSVEKCRNKRAKFLVSPHYGLMPEHFNDTYWELFLSTVDDYKNFLFELFRQGLQDEEVLTKYEEMRRGGIIKKEQPTEAFIMNARNVIKVFKKEFEAGQ